MSEVYTTETAPAPDISHIVIEDDTALDNFRSEKQQRLLTEALYSSWRGWDGSSRFIVAANVGVFYALYQPPLVPDLFLSLDVTMPDDWREKKHRTYFTWEFGKAPDVVIEIVSNKQGNELGTKLRDYARMRVGYYIVFDPLQQLGETLLRVFELRATSYEEMSQTWLEKVGLGVMLWEGEFEGKQDVWLRWCDPYDRVILTGKERAERAEARAARLAEQLRALGVDEEEIDRLSA